MEGYAYSIVRLVYVSFNNFISAVDLFLKTGFIASCYHWQLLARILDIQNYTHKIIHPCNYVFLILIESPIITSLAWICTRNLNHGKLSRDLKTELLIQTLCRNLHNVAEFKSSIQLHLNLFSLCVPIFVIYSVKLYASLHGHTIWASLSMKKGSH